MLVISPHSSTSSWIPSTSPSIGYSTTTGSTSKQRMASSCYKRKIGDINDDDQRASMDDTDSEDGNKRSRAESSATEKRVHFPSVKESHHRRASRPPTIDEQRAWASQSLECSQDQMELDNQMNEQDSSVWMNISGDGSTPTPTISETSSPSFHELFIKSGFKLQVSTPTGHPHPYAQCDPSRSQLGAGYFDLVR